MNAAVDSQLAEAVVARGRSVVDASGSQKLAGETATVLEAELAALVVAGFLVDPANQQEEEATRHDAEAVRIAATLLRQTQTAVTIASNLRPLQEDGEARARQFRAKLKDLRGEAVALVRHLTGETPPAETRAKPAVQTGSRDKEAARIAENLFRGTNAAVAVAHGLVPLQKGGDLRARQFLATIDSLGTQADELIAVLQPSGTPKSTARAQ